MPTSAPNDSSEFRAFYDGLPIAVALLDEHFRFSAINSAFELNLDYAAEELRGRPLSQLLEEGSRERLPMLLAQLRDDERPQQVISCRVISRSGRGFDASIHLSVVAEPAPRRYLAMLQSTGEIHERERLLLSQAEMFRVTIEQSPLPMSIQDNDFRFVMVNRAYVEFTGYGEEELLGRDAADFLHPSEARGTVRQQRDLVHRQGLSDLPRFSMRRELIHRDGRRVPYRMELGRSRGLDGQPLWVAVLIDLSKQEQAEARQAALLASVEAGVAHVVDGVVVQINPALSKITGRAQHELLDQPATVLFTDPTSWPRLESEVRSGSNPAIERRELNLRDARSRAGRRCEIALRAVDPRRSELGLILTVNDVGDLLERSDALEHSVSELQRLIDTEPVGIAHVDRGRIVRVNRTLRERLGRSEAELIGRLLTDFCREVGGRPDDAGPSLARLFESGVGQERMLRCELRPAQSDPVRCLLHLSPVPGRAAEAVAIVLDLSQHIAALDYASRMQLRFDAFAAMIDQAMVVVDARTNTVRYANPACADVLGLDARQLLGAAGASLWARLVAPDAVRAAQALNDARKGRAGELTVERAVDQSRQTIRLRFYLNADAAEVYTLCEDITPYVLEERQRLTEALAQREALVREVHHRIKNNLQGVAGLLEQTAIDQPALVEPVRKLAAKIQTIAQVHGLQIRPGQSIAAPTLVESVAHSLRRALGLVLVARGAWHIITD